MKMRSAGLYSNARYGLYFEQYIDQYIINKSTHVLQYLRHKNNTIRVNSQIFIKNCRTGSVIIIKLLLV